MPAFSAAWAPAPPLRSSASARMNCVSAQEMMAVVEPWEPNAAPSSDHSPAPETAGGEPL